MESAEKELYVLSRLKSGDEQAFEEIYRQYAYSLTEFASSKLASLEEAQDLIHDLFVYLWTERGTLQITGSLKGFLFAAARYRVIDHIRKNITRSKYANAVQALEPTPVYQLEKELEAQELGGLLENAVARLSPRVQEVYRLSRHEELSIAEIASELNLSDQTVKNQLGTALKHLRRVAVKASVWLLLAAGLS
ncbi:MULTISPECIES: RNA polymerase sigma factor [Rufibacter]|uniref:RNA polymerase sigma-70 factor (ECF subfamily) n=1 Tax=Rufibacter quisquiliarum TaxID=1549639 RepID=A0A839GR26_9BACT|nr:MULTISPECIES: RNA polymerase sigma-70 factor [Rufibacter]MBA9079299.1 RNA polymerase sigma-70 factor (ECF subfamily) [Rufibacter quisquiliarum]